MGDYVLTAENLITGSLADDDDAMGGYHPCPARETAPTRPVAFGASASSFEPASPPADAAGLRHSVPGLFNSCRKTPACLDGKLMANDLEAGPRSREPASDLPKLVGDTGIEPVTSSASNALILMQIGKLYESVGLRFTEKDRNDWILAFDLLIEAALTRVAARFTAT